MRKSGSGEEDQFVSTLSWYNEMSFLDNSIVIRKATDNSMEYNFKSENCEEEEQPFQGYFATNSSKKPEFNEVSQNKRKSTATVNIDRVLEKFMNENETEYAAFGASIAQQLENMPVEQGVNRRNSKFNNSTKITGTS